MSCAHVRCRLIYFMYCCGRILYVESLRRAFAAAAQMCARSLCCRSCDGCFASDLFLIRSRAKVSYLSLHRNRYEIITVAILITVLFPTSRLARVSTDKAQIRVPRSERHASRSVPNAIPNQPAAPRLPRRLISRARGGVRRLGRSWSAAARQSRQDAVEPVLPARSRRCASTMRSTHLVERMAQKARPRLTHGHDEACEPNGHAFTASMEK